MEMFPYKVDTHDTHDDQWCIVSSVNQLTVCIACLVEYLEDQSLTVVQRQFNLSLLGRLLLENDEVHELCRDHPPVCQLILDIMTDYYTGSNFMMESVEICIRLLDALQSEELHLYLLDKCQSQVHDNIDTVPFVVALLGKLAVISSAYTLTLILFHEQLLLFLLETRGNTPEDEISECSLMFLLIHLFDVDVLPVVPSAVLPLVEQCLVRWMTSAQSENLQISAVALLKRVLRANCCLRDDSENWATLLLGLKRLYVSKKEVLVTAATQCVIMIATIPSRSHALLPILESDLPEFLFEALHTLNVVQLEAVFRCLYLLAEHDQFFKRCHAIYGLESVLRSLDATLETQNITVLVNGFSLLASILKRQPSTIPIFVNNSAMELTISVITKGARSHAVQIVVLALTAATALLKDPKVARQRPVESMQTIVEAALTTMGSVVWRGEASDVLSSLQITEHQVLNTSLSFLTSCVTLSNEEENAVSMRLIEESRCNIIPYFSNHFTSADDDALRTLFNFLNSLYERHLSSTQDVTEKAVSSRLVLHILMKKTDLRSDLDLLSMANDFLVNTFHVLLKESVPQCQSLPDDLRSGLRQLSFQGNIEDTVGTLEKNAATALCMILYFSCLNDSEIFSPSFILQVVKKLHASRMLYGTPEKPLTTRFLLYLLAWANCQWNEEADSCSDLQNVENAVVSQASDLPIEVWATPSPQVFIWLFHTSQRSQKLGAMLLEHWLLHTKGNLNLPVEEGYLKSHTICSLFFNQHFRTVLIDLMTSTSEEISVLSRKLTTTLITIGEGRTDKETADLVHSLIDEIMSRFLSLFTESPYQSCHAVNNLLQTIVTVNQHPLCEPSEIDHAQRIRVIQHVVHYISTLDSKDSEILYNGLVSLNSLSKTTNAEQDQSVVPILLQNNSFIQQLEKCLQNDEWRISSAALSVTSWISSTPSDYTVDKPVRISVDFILQTITNLNQEQVVPLLKVLNLSLNLSHSGVIHPLSFYRSHNLHHPDSLYAIHELRLLVCYIQQHICSEDKEIQSAAILCYLKLLTYTDERDSDLGDNFIHHPWNPQLLLLLLTRASSSGLELRMAELIQKIWCAVDGCSQEEVAKLILESVLVTEISDENIDALQRFVQKAKKQCQQNDLVEQLMIRFAAFENSLSFSQNTQISA